MKIGIIGNGVVGSATAEAFKSHEVRITDRIRAKETHPLSEVLESDIIFLCLPTPQEKGGMACDVSAIDSFFSHGMPDRFRNANLVLRSTVPIGYTRNAREVFGLKNLVHSPEFLTARTAKKDACDPTRLVIGSENGVADYRLSLPQTCMTILYQLYEQRWPEVQVRIYCMTSDESEAVKLFQNSFSAVKIAFFNSVKGLSDKLGLNWDRMLAALLAGGWINPAHTQVPGPDGKLGFGGTCLPKDLANLISCMGLVGQDSSILYAAHTYNKEVRGC